MQKIQKSACVVILSFLFLQSELPQRGIQESRSFLVKNEWFKNILKKNKKIFCQFKKSFYFCTRKRKRNGFEFVNREEIIKILNIEQPSKERPERVITLSESRKNIQWRVWSWLRMNASGRPNTCKPSGICWLAC